MKIFAFQAARERSTITTAGWRVGGGVDFEMFTVFCDFLRFGLLTLNPEPRFSL